MSWPARASWRLGPGFADAARGKRPPSQATDDFFASYLGWRQACEDARHAYDRWKKWESPRRGLAFAAYGAALDGEEYAARVHADRSERLRAQEAA
jgi:hypothetical protein